MSLIRPMIFYPAFFFYRVFRMCPRLFNRITVGALGRGLDGIFPFLDHAVSFFIRLSHSAGAFRHGQSLQQG